MRLIAFISSTLLLAIVAFAQLSANGHWENGYHIVELDRPFPLLRYRAPDSPHIYAPKRSHCAAAGKKLRICKAISSAETSFVFELNGMDIGKWPASTYNGGDSTFEVLSGDLDGDGNDEIVIADLAKISNGMGVHTWTISIFPNLQNSGFQRPLEFSVAEFGARGTFVKHPGKRRCQILVTEWQYVDHPKSGTGMYIIGRWYEYNKGFLIPVKERPTIMRRLLYGFNEQVAKTQDDASVPLRWFKNLHTETVNIEPAALGREIRSVNGVINRVIFSGNEDEYYGMKMEVNLESGQSRLYKYSARSFEHTDDYFFRLGSAKAERIYPEDYSPASSRDWLIGRRVRITSYELSTLGSRLGTRQIVWLQDQ